jgi:hypothetical protein
MEFKLSKESPLVRKMAKELERYREMTYEEAKKIVEQSGVMVINGDRNNFERAIYKLFEALEEVEELRTITGIMQKRKYYHRFVKEVWQKEHGELSYPDADEIYRLYFEQQERLDRIVEQIHGYFKEQLDIRTEGLQEYPLGLIDDILKHNKAICEIVKGGAE